MELRILLILLSGLASVQYLEAAEPDNDERDLIELLKAYRKRLNDKVPDTGDNIQRKEDGKLKASTDDATGERIVDNDVSKHIDTEVNNAMKELEKEKTELLEERRELGQERERLSLVARILVDIVKGDIDDSQLNTYRRRRPCIGCP
ncbi:unnamed protein product [Owenia fusiformis]|uniref:Uncharacterized protein n=1 Tax=Owenia fusiformis TaxID=6347 RepID=A0A8S4MXP2_OWEFU|nr:unnamed protein product [Owenia fusiformis]